MCNKLHQRHSAIVGEDDSGNSGDVELKTSGKTEEGSKSSFLDFVVLSDYFGSLPFVDETASEVKIEVPVAMWMCRST